MNEQTQTPSLEEMENAILSKALDITGKHLAASALSFFLALNEAKALQDLPCHGDEIKRQRHNIINAPLGTLRELVKMMGGLNVLLQGWTDGQPLLQNVVLPTQTFTA